MLPIYVCVCQPTSSSHTTIIFSLELFFYPVWFSQFRTTHLMMLYFKFLYAVLQYICCIENHYNLQNIFHVSAHLPLDTSLPPTLIHQMSGLPFSPTQQCQPNPWHHHSFLGNDTNNFRHLTKYERGQGLLTKLWINITLPFPPEI